MKQRSIYAGTLAGTVLLLAIGLAFSFGRPNTQPKPLKTTPPPAVTLDYARANLPHPERDGYAYQAALLTRIAGVLGEINCYCGCRVSLKACYEKRACPPY